MALPNPNKPAPFTGLDQPQFYKSLNPATGAPIKNDAAFINTCSYILKTYQNDGTVGQPPANPAGCADVAGCKAAFTAAGWWQSYGFVAP